MQGDESIISQLFLAPAFETFNRPATPGSYIAHCINFVKQHQPLPAGAAERRGFAELYDELDVLVEAVRETMAEGQKRKEEKSAKVASEKAAAREAGAEVCQPPCRAHPPRALRRARRHPPVRARVQIRQQQAKRTYNFTGERENDKAHTLAECARTSSPPPRIPCASLFTQPPSTTYRYCDKTGEDSHDVCTENYKCIAGWTKKWDNESGDFLFYATGKRYGFPPLGPLLSPEPPSSLLPLTPPTPSASFPPLRSTGGGGGGGTSGARAVLAEAAKSSTEILQKKFEQQTAAAAAAAEERSAQRELQAVQQKRELELKQRELDEARAAREAAAEERRLDREAQREQQERQFQLQQQQQDLMQQLLLRALPGAGAPPAPPQP